LLEPHRAFIAERLSQIPHLTLHGLRLVFERNRDSQRGRLKTAR